MESSPIIEGNSGEVATPTTTVPQQPLPISSNIRVVCRVRPLTELEMKKNEHSIVFFHDPKSISIRANGPQFTFDRIFGFKDSQADVFEDVAEPIVNDFLDGYHGTIIAYGQTASGKTFTMVGDPIQHGIIPRVIENIFLGITKMREKDTSLSLAFCLKISALELYNEKLYDLYDANKSNLSIREHKQNGIYVEGISERVISSIEEAYDFLNISNNNRAIAATKMSAASSRSHSVLMIELSQQNLSMESSKISKLFLVDLAGSERAHKTGAEGDRMQEAKNINLSLSALGKVINALTCGASYIPYRDSKLTRVLQDSLGGNSKTSLIINCSPSNNNEHETITTLQFGTRAKTIKNQPKINKKITYHELELFIIKLAQDLEKSRKECEEITRSKNLEINNLLIQLENNQKLIVESNQKLEILNNQNQVNQSINNTFNEIENNNDKIILDDLNDLNDSNNGGDDDDEQILIVEHQSEQQQEDDEQENEDKQQEDEQENKNNSSYDSIKLEELSQMEKIKDIILNGTVHNDDNDDNSESSSFDDSDNEYLNQSKEIKISTIDFQSTSTFENSTIGVGSSGNHLRVSTSYITSSPSVSPRFMDENNNNNNSSNNNNNNGNVSPSSSPPLISFFKTKDFTSSDFEIDQKQQKDGSSNNSLGSSSGDNEEEDDDDVEDMKSTTSTTTTTTTIDINANQPPGINDPIEFTIIKSDKTVTSTQTDREIIANDAPSSDISSNIESSTFTSTSTTTTTTTKLSNNSTNQFTEIDIVDFGFSKIEEIDDDNYKPNQNRDYLTDIENQNDIITDSDLTDEENNNSKNNLLKSFNNSENHHRGDFGATPTKSVVYINNNNYEFDSPISSKPHINQSPSTVDEPLQPTFFTTTTTTTTTTPPVKKRKKSFCSVYLPWLLFLTILFSIVSLGYLHYPEYKQRLLQRRNHLNAIGIESDYPTVELLSTLKKNQILFAKELYGQNSKEFYRESTIINTSYNTLVEMNYMEKIISNILGSSISLKFFEDYFNVNKTMDFKRRVYSLESNSANSDNQQTISSMIKQVKQEIELENENNLKILNDSFRLKIEKYLYENETNTKKIKELNEKVQMLESQIIQEEVGRNDALITKISELSSENRILKSDKKSLGNLVSKLEQDFKEFEKNHPIIVYHSNPLKEFMDFIKIKYSNLSFSDFSEYCYDLYNNLMSKLF